MASKQDTGLQSPATSTTDEVSIDDFPASTGSHLGYVEPHIFSHPARAEHWRNIYDHAKYEGRSRFDPSFRWSPQGEVTVKRKVFLIPLERLKEAVVLGYDSEEQTDTDSSFSLLLA
jgi:hypothetical protein